MGRKNARIHLHLRFHRHHLCWNRIIQLVMSFFLLNLSCSIQSRYLAEGRAVPGLVHADPKEEGRAAVEQSLIGSRPPSCGRSCVAVQEPVTPQIGSQSLRHNLRYARVDDISNYKPMTWKCKCGDFFYNP